MEASLEDHMEASMKDVALVLIKVADLVYEVAVICYSKILMNLPLPLSRKGRVPCSTVEIEIPTLANEN